MGQGSGQVVKYPPWPSPLPFRLPSAQGRDHGHNEKHQEALHLRHREQRKLLAEAKNLALASLCPVPTPFPPLIKSQNQYKP